MKNETMIHIEFDADEFTANLILVSDTDKRKEVLICEGMNINTMPSFIRAWSTFATFTFAPC